MTTTEALTPQVYRRMFGRRTDKQAGYIIHLLDQLAAAKPEVHAAAAPWWAQAEATASFDLAHRTIDRLKAHLADVPAAAPAPRPAPADRYTDVPDGYYALEADGHVSFYRVSTYKPTERYPRPGRKVQCQASDELHPMSAAAGYTILAKVRAGGVLQCAQRYAAELVRCYRCGRTLTDDVSRAVGMGETCRGRA